MSAAGAPRTILPLLFAVVAGSVYTVSISLAGALPELRRADVLSAAMAVDMLVLVPLAFFFLVARPRAWPVATVVPVVVLSLIAAGRVLPEGHRRPLEVAEAAAVPLELGLLLWIGVRAARAWRGAGSGDGSDPLERLHEAALRLVGSDRAAALLASEIAVGYYALAAWRARPHVPSGWRPVTQHLRSGHGGVVFGLTALLAVEGPVIHLLVARWSGVLAWVVTAATVYSFLWLLADYRATLLRPILVGQGSLRIRAGLRWTMVVGDTDILEIRGGEPEDVKERLNLTLLGSPTHWILFTRPLEVRGPYGMGRTVRAVGVHPDTPAFPR
jgi:hypothetical protein